MSSPGPVRVAVVPPVPVPYREPLFRELAGRESLRLRVIYQSDREPGWDQPPEWFPAGHPYDAIALRAHQRARPGRSPLRVPRGLGRALSQFDPECVVVSEYGPATLRSLAWCRRRGRPLVVLTECTPEIDQLLPRLQLRLHRWIARRAEGFVATSSAARRRLEAMGVAPERIEVSLQSADTAAARAASPGPRAAEGSGGPVRVLSVGRLVPDKNFGRLLEALATLGEDEAELEICGSGPLEGELRARARALGVDGRVRLSGFVAPEELPGRYAAADVFALVSTVEPFGVSAREAAAAGLPLVCTRTAGAAGDVALGGRNAILVDPLDVEEIAAALGRVCRDGELRVAMSRASWELGAARGIDDDVDAFERAVLRAEGRLSTAGEAPIPAQA